MLSRKQIQRRDRFAPPRFQKHMPAAFPFLWQSKGVIESLEHLPAGQVLQRDDVTRAVSGSDSDAHRLLVVALAGGKVIGDLRLVATQNDLVIGDVQSVFGRGGLAGHHALQRRRLRLPKYRRGTALLLGASNSDSYYHWLVDSLPRWRLLQAAGWRDYDCVLLHGQPRQFQEEMLDWLGVPAAKRLRCSKNFVHQFERLVVPTMPFARKTNSAWVGAWLHALVPKTNAGPEKIFLSRRGAPGRQLANEDELFAALAPLGFARVQPERLAVAEQARRLGAAHWVVAPHGAALANLAFAPPGAQLLELFHPEHKNRVHENLAAACGHRYASLDGSATNRAGDPQLQYTVDVAAVLRKITEEILSEFRNLKKR